VIHVLVNPAGNAVFLPVAHLGQLPDRISNGFDTVAFDFTGYVNFLRRTTISDDLWHKTSGVLWMNFSGSTWRIDAVPW